MKRPIHKQTIILTVLAFLLSTGCGDLIDVPPPDTEIVRETVFENENTALSAMAGIYNKLTNSQINNITITEGVYADELISYADPGNPMIPFYVNKVAAANSIVSSMWAGWYNIIYSANNVIEGLENSRGVSETVHDQLSGEALFIRAFSHFYLVNLFGEIPYVTQTDYRVNAKVSRIPVDEVYDKIIQDLLEARHLLSNNYPSSNRVRVNKHAATALLARAYLYNHEWLSAEAQASELINNSSQYALEVDLNKTFQKGSNEIIWQLIPPYGYTNEGAIFILVAPPDKVALRNDLINSFEPDDSRKKKWTDSILSTSGLSKWFYAYKYKNKNVSDDSEYSVVLRLAEQFLIRAEARAEQDNLIGIGSAESDINVIRNRAGLLNTTAQTKVQLLAAIAQEREVELFTEWGHRFLDLKRWEMLDVILDPIKPNWDTTDKLLPIPQSELFANSKLTQNPGY